MVLPQPSLRATTLAAEKQMGGPTAGTRATVPQAPPPLGMGVEHPANGSGISREADTVLWDQGALPNAPNSLPSAPPANVAGNTSSCMHQLLGTSCVTPAPRSRSPDCKGVVGTIAGHRPP